MQIRKRQDLQIFPRGAGSTSQWVVKDPVAFNHFLFSAEELFLLNLFDGSLTLEQIRTRWQAEFRTAALSEQQLKSLAERFARDNLVVVDRFGRGSQLHQDECRAKRSRLMSKLSSPLVIKLGGFDPREFLDLLWLPGKLLFHRFVIIANLLIAILVFGYFVGHFEEIAQRAYSMTGFFTAKNFVVMTAVIIVVKVIHEFGHAVACRNYGGECFEIGVLLLAFFPTLYCDVTDSWTFSDRWKRIMVSFAGIYVEIILAAISAALWLTTSPGLANSVFFNVALMCSINTIFINGNPLLRYDGYYMVSDFFEKPNLSQKARQQVNHVLSGFFFDETRTTERNLGIAIFGFLSTIYRWFVVGSIALGLYVVLRSFEFGLLSELVVAMLLATIGYRSVKQSVHEMRTAPPRRLNWLRSFAVTGFIGLLGVLCWGMPLPSYVYCNFSVEPEISSVVYASRKGKLELQVAAYERVTKGQTLGQLIDLELHENRQRTVNRLENLEQRGKRMIRRFEQSPELASEAQVLQNEIQKVQSQLTVLEKEIADLTLQAPADGMIRPLPLRIEKEDYLDSAVQIRQGTLFDAANRHFFVRRGHPLLVVQGDAQMLVSYLGEKDVEFLQAGQKVVVGFHQAPRITVDGVIKEIIETDVELDDSAEELSGLETFVDNLGQTKTRQTPYRVIISAERIPDHVLTGSHGRARILVPSRTLAEKVWFVLSRWWEEQNY